uniref:Uncharacterized protein n=1 Tax=Setaria italica TaxID=4555 RepID=K4AG55_SETIT
MQNTRQCTGRPCKGQLKRLSHIFCVSSLTYIEATRESIFGYQLLAGEKNNPEAASCRFLLQSSILLRSSHYYVKSQQPPLVYFHLSGRWNLQCCTQAQEGLTRRLPTSTLSGGSVIRSRTAPPKTSAPTRSSPTRRGRTKNRSCGYPYTSTDGTATR